MNNGEFDVTTLPGFSEYTQRQPDIAIVTTIINAINAGILTTDFDANSLVKADQSAEDTLQLREAYHTALGNQQTQTVTNDEGNS